MEQEEKNNFNANPINKRVLIRKDEDLELKNRLLNSPELFIQNKGEDEYLDRLSLKIKLFGGKEFTLQEYISENLVQYQSRFFKDFYYQIARINGLQKEVMDVYKKPDCAKTFTIQFVYGRFPMKVFNELRRKNTWTEIPGVREHKLFQYLSTIASEHLDLYIEQAYRIMLESSNLLEFQMKYSKQYKMYFQIDMFSGEIMPA